MEYDYWSSLHNDGTIYINDVQRRAQKMFKMFERAPSEFGKRTFYQFISKVCNYLNFYIARCTLQDALLTPHGYDILHCLAVEVEQAKHFIASC